MIANPHKPNRDRNVADPIQGSINAATSDLNAGSEVRSTNHLSGIELQCHLARSHIASFAFDQNITHIGANGHQSGGCQQRTSFKVLSSLRGLLLI